MELDDLKRDWELLNKQAEREAVLKPLVVNKIIEQKYYSNLKKIIIPELTGDAICFLCALYLSLNLNKFDTTFFKLTVIVAILILIVLPILSLMSVRKFKFMENLTDPVVEMLAKFSSQKQQFYKFQRLNLMLSSLLLVCTIMLMSKLFNTNNSTAYKSYWIYSFSAGYIFLLFCSKWVMAYYTKSLNKTEDLLKGLNS